MKNTVWLSMASLWRGLWLCSVVFVGRPASRLGEDEDGLMKVVSPSSLLPPLFLISSLLFYDAFVAVGRRWL